MNKKNISATVIIDSINENLRKIGEFIDIGDVSDGYHTFNDLYEQRLHLTAAVANAYPNLCWKTHRHEDGELCFGGGWFLVNIDTPEGQYSYHYEDKYWDMFHCRELERAKHFDGHTSKDVGRLDSLAETLEGV